MFQNLAYDDWNQGVTTSWADAYQECAEMIRELPSAEPEIIRCKECKHRDVVNMLNHAPTIEPQKWIPITEAEPGAAHVLATLRWDEDDYEVTEMDYWAIVAAQGDKDKVISARAKDIIEHVIALMPLPEPYKEGEK